MNAADYDRFSVVAFASPPVRDKVEELRRLLPPSGRPIIAPHVTTKGTFVDPTDLDEIAAKARAICEAVGPINVTLGDLYQYGNREHGGLGFGLAAPAALVDLHGRLVAAIEPLCTPLD